MIIEDVDFAAMYQAHLKKANRSHKTSDHWDKRAEEMAVSCANPNDPYIRDFLAMMDLTGADTLLDMGCGPGSICLAAADRFEQVYGVDYSAQMLTVCRRRAVQLGLGNVNLLQRAWEDDWQDIPVCDIAVASRSTLVGDLHAAMYKLNQHARLRVYTTHTVSPTFIDPRIIRAIGREVVTLPNYLYAVTVLEQMGIHPKVDYITSLNCQGRDNSYEDFEHSVSWSLGGLSEAETMALRQFYDSHKQPGKPLLAGDRSWAMVYWDKVDLD
ncbi:methyltransferase [Shewanella sp. NFH-SH190041]|uniref:class I SAM-dependent methyltransferase n=1 Tax=Shewanella sp. NFH-SH190041 TaxID=2950245 RepID=UPI0021C426A5|nr:class I SAM-dependent methyltransferase [Shewanella sp. NFH-SH190041]BDM65346.1 methyltransferase [Shewanella sp. NFH-SH190041]